MTRDLPSDTDFEDLEARYGTHFGLLWSSDDAYDWPRLLNYYRDSDAAERRVINDVFIYLVGYTLPSLVDLSHGRSV
jgi:hypothetical protein